MTTKTKTLSGKARVAKAAKHAHAKVIAGKDSQPTPDELMAALMGSGAFDDIEGDDGDDTES